MLRQFEEASMTSVLVIKFYVNFKTHGFTKIGLFYYYYKMEKYPNIYAGIISMLFDHSGFISTVLVE